MTSYLKSKGTTKKYKQESGHKWIQPIQQKILNWNFFRSGKGKRTLSNESRNCNGEEDNSFKHV